VNIGGCKSNKHVHIWAKNALMNGDSVDDKASQCQSKLLCGQHNMLNLNGCDMNQRKMNLQKTIHT
jgi:hypothetical protein